MCKQKRLVTSCTTKKKKKKPPHVSATLGTRSGRLRRYRVEERYRTLSKAWRRGGWQRAREETPIHCVNQVSIASWFYRFCR